jgi:hypothetical protein
MGSRIFSGNVVENGTVNKQIPLQGGAFAKTYVDLFSGEEIRDFFRDFSRKSTDPHLKSITLKT